MSVCAQSKKPWIGTIVLSSALWKLPRGLSRSAHENPDARGIKIANPIAVSKGSRCLRSKTLLNAMTVDVEDYFQVEVFANRISRASWDDIPSRVEANVETLLNLFAANGVNATFFTLGWIAERHPEMVRRITVA